MGKKKSIFKNKDQFITRENTLKVLKKLKGVEKRICKRCLVRIVCNEPCDNLHLNIIKKLRVWNHMYIITNQKEYRGNVSVKLEKIIWGSGINWIRRINDAK